MRALVLSVLVTSLPALAGISGAVSPPIERNTTTDGGTLRAASTMTYGQNAGLAVPLQLTDAGAILTYTVHSDTNMTAFNEQRVSVPYTLFDMGSGRYGNDTREVAMAVGDGGATTNVLRESGFQLSVNGANTAFAKARTNSWFRYQAGRGQLVTMTLTQSACPTNQTRRWGYFDEHDGLYFQVASGVLSVVRRTSTSENASCTGCHKLDGGSIALSEQTVAQSSWNVNKMPGLDWTKGNIWQIQFQWLGVGTVKWFVNGVLVHEMDHAGMMDYPYMRSATLPLTWEIVNTGTADAGSMTGICANVTSQSGTPPPEYSYAYANAAVSVGNATEIPLITMRLKQVLGGADNHIVVLPKTVFLENTELTGNALAEVAVRFNATLTGATYAVSAGAASGVEIDNAASAFSNGELVGVFYVQAATSGQLDVSHMFGEVERKMRRDAATGVSDTLTITAIMSGGTHPLVPAFQWVEVK